MPKTHTERLWLLGGGIVAVLMVLIGYMMFISPQNSNTSSAQSQVSSAKAVNQRLQARIAELKVQSKNLAQYQTELRLEQLALPSSSGLPDFLRTLQSIGNATQAQLSALTVGPPADVTGIAGGAGTATSSTPSSSATSSAATGGLRVYSLPITAVVTGSYAQLDGFLTQLQSVQPRAVLISQLTEGTGTSGTPGATGGTSLQLTMQAFVAPIGAAEQAQLSAASGK
jgi:type IV pilus assembly protein PilO